MEQEKLKSELGISPDDAATFLAKRTAALESAAYQATKKGEAEFEFEALGAVHTAWAQTDFKSEFIVPKD